MKAGSFLQEFIKHPHWTGTFFASTEAMGEAIVEYAQLQDAASIVELGSGDGVFTKAINRRLRPDADFFAIEINPLFAKATRLFCPGVDVYVDSAEHIQKYLSRRGLKHCDIIVSALPWAAFNRELQVRLLTAVERALRPGGRFVTIAYISGLPLPAGRRFRQQLEEQFTNVEMSRIVWRNRPPAIVYRAQKKV
jgi:phospholipid N-methyltransferase